HPDVAKQQRQADKEQPHQRIAGARAYACLVQLSVTGLDAEAATIGLPNPLRRRGAHPPTGINPALRTTRFPSATLLPAPTVDHAYANHGMLFPHGADGVRRPAALLPEAESGAACPRRPTPRKARRHQKWIAGALQIADHGHTVKTAIEQQKPRPNPGTSCL